MVEVGFLGKSQLLNQIIENAFFVFPLASWIR